MLWNFKKVLFVVNSLVSFGGVERNNLKYILYLREKGFNIHLCALRAIGKTAEIYRKEGIPVDFFRAYRAGEKGRNCIFLQGFFSFMAFLWKERFGIIVATQAPSNYLARFACLPRFGRRLFSMEQVATWKRKKKFLILDKICSLWTDKIICVSPWVRDGLVKKAGVPLDKTIVIEMPYNIEKCDEEFKLYVQKSSFIFGCVSAFMPKKRQEVLIKAFKKLTGYYKDIHLVLAGSGPEEKKLKNLVSSLGLEENVNFLGYISNPHCLYPLLDAFVFPSVSEGMPGVLVEASLHGLPIITTKIRPMTDYFIHGENALLFEADNVDDLAYWMKFLIKNRDIREKLGKKAQETAKKYFDFNRQREKFYRLITATPDLIRSGSSL